MSRTELRDSLPAPAGATGHPESAQPAQLPPSMPARSGACKRVDGTPRCSRHASIAQLGLACPHFPACKFLCLCLIVNPGLLYHRTMSEGPCCERCSIKRMINAQDDEHGDCRSRTQLALWYATQLQSNLRGHERPYLSIVTSSREETSHATKLISDAVWAVLTSILMVWKLRVGFAQEFGMPMLPKPAAAPARPVQRTARRASARVALTEDLSGDSAWERDSPPQRSRCARRRLPKEETEPVPEAVARNRITQRHYLQRKKVPACPLFLRASASL